MIRRCSPRPRHCGTTPTAPSCHPDPFAAQDDIHSLQGRIGDDVRSLGHRERDIVFVPAAQLVPAPEAGAWKHLGNVVDECFVPLMIAAGDREGLKAHANSGALS